jgi:hypothetical protein
MVWQEPTTPIDVAQWLASQLQTLRRYPGTDFEPEAVFREVGRVLQLVVETRLGRGHVPHTIGPLIELLNDEWTLTSEGLECLVEQYEIDRERIQEPTWEEHMSKKVWLDADKFARALEVAQAYLGRTSGFRPF